MRLSAEADDDVAERAVIEVEHALPDDAAHVDIERVALLDVVVDDGGEQIVRRRDGMEVAREMEVDVLHRDDLRIAAARGSALQAEARAERRLAERDRRLLAHAVERIGEADARRRLALAGRRRVDGRDEDELAVRLVLHTRIRLRRDFRLVFSVKLQLIVRDAQLCGDLLNRTHLSFLCDFDIGLHIIILPQITFCIMQTTPPLLGEVAPEGVGEGNVICDSRFYR